MNRSILFLIGILALSGCSTVHQQTVIPGATVAQPEPIKTPVGYVIDQPTRDRYNALVDVYGTAKYEDGAPVFIPSLKRDAGVDAIGNGKYLMTFAARQDFATLKGMQLMAFPVQK